MAWLPLFMLANKSRRDRIEEDRELDNRIAARRSRDYFAKRDKEREEERQYWKGRK